jgi:hypothetical protein
MIEARSHLIRAGAGRVRVLRLAIVDGHCEPFRYIAHYGRGTCYVRGCTDAYGCYGGCAWANASHTICTRCLERQLT